jgi:LPXTG-site transpeptidase (sortase) family protein
MVATIRSGAKARTHFGAGQELTHALAIAEQIDYLCGLPTVLAKAVRTSEKATEMLQFDLDNETETIHNYRERVRQCEDLAEYAMGEQIRGILIDEQGHQIALATAPGTAAQTVRLGVGHIEGTALPGEPGNIGVAGHRDTYFRELRNIRTNDEIQIQTATGLTRYRVDWMQIVAPSDAAILAPSTTSALTLVTCYPFHFIGAAPERYVVHAYKR